MNTDGPRVPFTDFWAQQLKRIAPEYNRACLTGRARIRTAVALQWAQSEGLSEPYPAWFLEEVGKVGSVYLGG